MRPIIIAALASVFLVTFAPPRAHAAEVQTRQQTLTGIPLDSRWKEKLYSFAREKLKHPAWGWTHSERDYNLASEIDRKSTRLNSSHP